MITIKFYETNKAYGCFSNFSKHPIEVNSRTWPTSEHFFQAAKFTDSIDVEAVFCARTPFIAAQLGRERGRSFRADWNAVRDEVMRTALRAKFTQHPALGSILASTNGAQLVEHTANDRYWADGGDGSGANMLGKLLEQVRSELPSYRDTYMVPPWVQHPDIAPEDLFWRMGRGEDFLSAAQRFRENLPLEARVEYDTYFPVPEAWRGTWI